MSSGRLFEREVEVFQAETRMKSSTDYHHYVYHSDEVVATPQGTGKMQYVPYSR